MCGGIIKDMKILKQLLSSSLATLTIVALVFLLLVFGAIPYNAEIFSYFLIGAGLLAFGQAIFLVAIDQSVIKMGEAIGSSLMKLKKVYPTSGQADFITPPNWVCTRRARSRTFLVASRLLNISEKSQ